MNLLNEMPDNITEHSYHYQRASRIDSDINTFIDQYQEKIENYNNQKYKSDTVNKFSMTATGLGLAGIVATNIAAYAQLIDIQNLGLTSLSVVAGITSLITASLMINAKSKTLYKEIQSHEQEIQKYDWIDISDKDVKSIKKAIDHDNDDKLESKKEEIKVRHPIYKAINKERPQ